MSIEPMVFVRQPTAAAQPQRECQPPAHLVVWAGLVARNERALGENGDLEPTQPQARLPVERLEKRIELTALHKRGVALHRPVKARVTGLHSTSPVP